MKKINALFILSNGRVAAINKADGAIVWEKKLKEFGLSSTAHSIGQIMVEDGKLYVGCAGILVCLVAKDGSLIWKNELKGWGFGFVSMANVSSDAAGAAANTAATASAVIVASS